MHYFRNKFNSNYVNISRGTVYIKNTQPLPTFFWSNFDARDRLSGPYMKVVKDYIDRRGEGGLRRIILATDDRNMALKTAAVFGGYGSASYEVDDWEWDCDYESYEDSCCGVTTVDLDLITFCDREKKELNLGVTLANINNNNESAIFISSVDVFNDWEDFFRCISYCKTPCQYIQISPKLIKTPAVQRLIYDFGFEVLELPEFPKDYYETHVMDVLLDGEMFELSKDCDKTAMVRSLIKKRGKYMSEEDIATFLDLARDNAEMDGNRLELRPSDFEVSVVVDSRNATDKLKSMVGLDNVKEVVDEITALMVESKSNPLLKNTREHMVFFGNPGTGKTTCGKLISSIFDEAGCGNGNFVMATRKDLIGKFVGHTANQVARKFNEARGGILFVDEAGFFLNNKSGDFVNEAIKEFVRYMEEYDDVTVIFAMYPREATEFFQLDEGLRSRITREVEFVDYTREQLLDIAVEMVKENGYILRKGAKQAILDYIDFAMNDDEEEFGNARTMRKLVKAMITQVSLRNLKSDSKDRGIRLADVNNATVKLKGIREEKRTIGFALQDTN